MIAGQSNCSIFQSVKYLWISENSGEIRGPLVDQIDKWNHVKPIQIGIDGKRAKNNYFENGKNSEWS